MAKTVGELRTQLAKWKPNGLPASGQISASDINVELGRPYNAEFNIGGAEERALAEVPTGQISFSDFHGKRLNKVDLSGLVDVHYYGDLYDYNAYIINADGTHLNEEGAEGDNPTLVVPDWTTDDGFLYECSMTQVGGTGQINGAVGWAVFTPTSPILTWLVSCLYMDYDGIDNNVELLFEVRLAATQVVQETASYSITVHNERVDIVVGRFLDTSFDYVGFDLNPINPYGSIDPVGNLSGVTKVLRIYKNLASGDMQINIVSDGTAPIPAWAIAGSAVRVTIGGIAFELPFSVGSGDVIWSYSQPAGGSLNTVFEYLLTRIGLNEIVIVRQI